MLRASHLPCVSFFLCAVLFTVQGPKAFKVLLRTRLRGVEKDPRLVAVLAALVWVRATTNTLIERVQYSIESRHFDCSCTGVYSSTRCLAGQCEPSGGTRGWNSAAGCTGIFTGVNAGALACCSLCAQRHLRQPIDGCLIVVTKKKKNVFRPEYQTALHAGCPTRRFQRRQEKTTAMVLAMLQPCSNSIASEGRVGSCGSCRGPPGGYASRNC